MHRKKEVLTVLHDITDDAKFVKVATAALCAERFLESDLDVGDRVLVEGRVNKMVAEAEHEDVLDHLLAEVVVNTEDLFRVEC